MPLHLPPIKRASEVQRFVAHFEGALEARLELADDAQMTPSDTVAMILNSLIEARKEMGW
jgi:hypothetical protein